jgi:DNA repair protein RecO (recombination protein O)
VLRSWPYGESDKIVSFFTVEHGKVTGIAKGARRSRKRFLNSLELFSFVNLRFQERANSSLAFIHACDWIRVFKDLTRNLEKIAAAAYLVEIADELTREREQNRPLFEHLMQGLTFIEEKGTSLSFLTIFEMKLLKLSGYQPMLDHCRRCREKRPGTRHEFGDRQPEVPSSGSRAGWRFSPYDGGILCEACSPFRRDTIPLSLEALDTLARIQQVASVSVPCTGISLSALKETRSVLPRFIQFQINKELKSVPFLDAFSSV